MVVRDEMLVIIDLTAGVIRAGVGVHDLIRAPQIVNRAVLWARSVD